jgi:hypothetical protein
MISHSRTIRPAATPVFRRERPIPGVSYRALIILDLKRFTKKLLNNTQTPIHIYTTYMIIYIYIYGIYIYTYIYIYVMYVYIYMYTHILCILYVYINLCICSTCTDIWILLLLWLLSLAVLSMVSIQARVCIRRLYHPGVPSTRLATKCCQGTQDRADAQPAQEVYVWCHRKPPFRKIQWTKEQQNSEGCRRYSQLLSPVVIFDLAGLQGCLVLERA